MKAPATTPPLLLAVPGTIQPKAKVELHPRIDGVIEKIDFEEGAPVKKGQLLVQLTRSGMTAQLGLLLSGLPTTLLVSVTRSTS